MSQVTVEDREKREKEKISERETEDPFNKFFFKKDEFSTVTSRGEGVTRNRQRSNATKSPVSRYQVINSRLGLLNILRYSTRKGGFRCTELRESSLSFSESVRKGNLKTETWRPDVPSCSHHNILVTSIKKSPPNSDSGGGI